MYPQEYATLVSEANAGKQQNFLLFERHRTSALDTGLFNYFKDEQGRTNCTIGDAVFSGRGHYGQFVWPDSSSYGVRRTRPSRFSAPMNFWSCALYPNITQAFRRSDLSPQNRTYLLENDVDTTETTSTAVTSFISTCLSSWCRESGNCITSSCAVDHLKVGDAMLSAASLDTCLDHLCRPIPRISSNPDIAGIGVISSYYIQFGFVMAGLLSLILCSAALKWIPPPHLPQSDSECNKFEPTQPPFVVETIKQTIITALDDFQRAQCSFAIAINTASLITLQLSAKTLSFVDRRAIVAASASGTLPTSLVLAALMASHKRHSTFTFYITFAAWVVSLSVGLHRQIFRYRDASSDYLTKYPGVCGKSPPVNVCAVERDVLKNAPTLFPIVVVTMVALTWWKLRATRALVRIWDMWPWKGRQCRSIPSGGTPLQGYFLVLVIVGITGVAYLYFLAYVTQIINERDWVVDWSFGQIVTVSGWLPTVLMLLNSCIYGPRQGHTNQPPEMLQVVRIDSVA